MDRRTQKMQARLRNMHLTEELIAAWTKAIGSEPIAVSLGEQQTPPNTNENTGMEVPESGSSGSKELTTSSVQEGPVQHSATAHIPPAREDPETMESTNAPNIPAKQYASDLPAKEHPSHTGKETEGGFQYRQELTTYSVPKAPVMHSATAPAKEDPETVESKTTKEGINLNSSPAQNPSNTKAGAAVLGMKSPTTSWLSRENVTKGPGTLTEEWHPEMDNIHPLGADLTFRKLNNMILSNNRSPPSILNARPLPVWQQICREEEFPWTIKKIDDTGKGTESSSSENMELTSPNAPNIPAKQCASDLPAKENPPHTEKKSVCGFQGSQELTTYSVLKAPVQHSATAPIPLAKEDPETMESTCSNVPNIPAKKNASDLPAKEIRPHTEKETDGSQELTRANINYEGDFPPVAKKN